MQEAWPKIEALFYQWMDLPEPDQQSAFLDTLRAQDAELYAELTALLEAHGQAQEFLTQSAYQSIEPHEEETDLLDLEQVFPVLQEKLARMIAEQQPPSSGDEPTSRLASQVPLEQLPVEERWIDQYRLIGDLGIGGMGRVFLAEQQHPVRRQVALKVLTTKLYSAQHVARFEVEHRFLGRMSHAFIAQIYDAGITAWKRPYFVMEFIEGMPLDQYCDTHRLDIQDRLKLFLKIAEGVRHAHGQRVIHLDLKPSNILIKEEEGVARPKIIDFGIAELVDHVDKPESSEKRPLIGSPLYLAPELASAQPRLDFPADVYGLGAILHHLLVGWPPFGDQLNPGQPATDQYAYALAHQITPLSKTFGENAHQVHERALARSSQPKLLRRQLKGDLQWMVDAALCKNPAQRYAQVEDLSADIKRYLAHRPISLRKHQRAYVWGRYGRRNRLALTLVGTVAISFLAILITLAFSYVSLAKANREVLDSLEVKGKTLEFTRDLIANADTYHYGRSVTLVEALEHSEAKIVDKMSPYPAAEASVRLTLGRSFVHLGERAKGRANLEKAYSYFQQAPADDPERITVEIALASLDLLAGNPERALPFLQRLRQLSPEALAGADYDPSEILNRLADAERMLGQLSNSETLYLEALKQSRDNPSLRYYHALTERGFATLLEETQRFDEARTRLTRAYETLLELKGPDHPETVFTLELLAWQAERAGDKPLLIHLYTDLYYRYGKLFEPGHPTIITFKQRLDWLKSPDDYERQLASLSDLLVEQSNHEDVLPSNFVDIFNRLASALIKVGALEESTVIHEDLISQFLGPSRDASRYRLGIQNNLGELLADLGRFREAEALLGVTLVEKSQQQPVNERSITYTKATLCEVRLRQRQFLEAYELSQDLTCLGPEVRFRTQLPPKFYRGLQATAAAHVRPDSNWNQIFHQIWTELAAEDQSDGQYAVTMAQLHSLLPTHTCELAPAAP